MHLCIQPTPSLFAFIINFHRLAAIYSQFVIPLRVLTLAWKYFYSGAGEEKQGRGMGNKIKDRSATPTEVSSPPLLATGGEDDCPSTADDDHNKPTFLFMGLFLDALQSEWTDSSSVVQWLNLFGFLRSMRPHKKSENINFCRTVVAGHILTRPGVETEWLCRLARHLNNRRAEGRGEMIL